MQIPDYSTNVLRAWQATRGVETWVHESEARTLFDLAASRADYGSIVEIGSWKGFSTIWLAFGSVSTRGNPVYAVDPHVGSPEHQSGNRPLWTFDEFRMNIRAAGIEDSVIPVVDTSENASAKIPEPISLVFIDGAHEYDMVRKDFELWFPKLMEGGIMAFHDTIGWPGPKEVVREFLASSTRFRNLRFVHSLTYGEKVQENTRLDRIHSSYVLGLKGLYERTVERTHPPKLVRKAAIRVFTALH